MDPATTEIVGSGDIEPEVGALWMYRPSSLKGRNWDSFPDTVIATLIRDLNQVSNHKDMRW
jgi:hypothetical protein